MNDHGFRFQHFDIWKRAISIGGSLHDLADRLDERGFRRYAEQLCLAALNISNNIAEGSGSSSDKEFSQFLNIAHRSAFETANMVLFLRSNNFVTDADCEKLLSDLEEECRMITGFRRNL